MGYIYKSGPAAGKDSDLYCVDGSTWCKFGQGSVLCQNGEACLNHNHTPENCKLHKKTNQRCPEYDTN